MMDRDELDRIARELAVETERDLDAVVGRLRARGCSMVESIYVIDSAFAVSLVDAKALVMSNEARRSSIQGLEEFHTQLAEDDRST